MALNTKIAFVAFDRQTTGKGTAAATRKYGLGLRGGRVVSVPLPQKPEELTVATRIAPSAYRDEEGPAGIDVTTRAWPRSIGMLLKLALGTGSDTVTGAVDPFVHTIIPANAMDYATFWGVMDTEGYQVRDCRIDELSMSWDGASPLEVGLSAFGTVVTFGAATTAATADDSGQQSFYAGGGTFQLDTISGTPVTADITGGSVTINNGLSPIRLSKSIEPDDMWPGEMTITWVLRVIPANANLWRAAITGAAGGTAVVQTPQFGSAHVLFTQGVTPARTLDLTSPKLSFDPGQFPDAVPAGGPAEFEFTGTAVAPAAGAPFTAVVNNSENAAAYGGS